MRKFDWGYFSGCLLGFEWDNEYKFVSFYLGPIMVFYFYGKNTLDDVWMH